jgi:hypothetical protein
MEFKYYLLDNGAGEPHEVYRSSKEGATFHTGHLERAKQDGSWSAEETEVRLVF